MEFYSPDTWREALEVKAAHPDAVPIFGGTDASGMMTRGACASAPG